MRQGNKTKRISLLEELKNKRSLKLARPVFSLSLS